MTELGEAIDLLAKAIKTGVPLEIVAAARKVHSTFLVEPLNFPKDISAKLVGFLCNKEISCQIRLLAALILRESQPLPCDIPLELGTGWDTDIISHVLQVALAQGYGDKSPLPQLLPRLIKWLSTVGYSAELQQLCLSTFLCISTQRPALLHQDQVNVIDAQLSEWLKSTSHHEAPSPHTRGFFRKDKQTSMLEVDGTMARNFFTILCIGKHYSGEQLLNIHTFSVLRRWILAYERQKPGGTSFHAADRQIFGEDASVPVPLFLPPESLPDSSVVSSFTGMPQTPSVLTPNDDDSDDSMSTVSITSMESGRSTPSVMTTASWSVTAGGNLSPLVSASLQYCLRVIDQCNRTSKNTYDGDIQTACLIECVSILDELCSTAPSIISRVFESIKRLLSKDGLNARVVVVLTQFLLNHSLSAGYDSTPIYERLLGSLLAAHFFKTHFAFDVVSLLKDNLGKFCYQTHFLSKYFPNILKVLAWNSRAYLEDFLELLPSFMSPTTAIEVFHSLLELPCLTAALEVNQLSKQRKETLSPSVISVIEAFNNHNHHRLFEFIMRNEAGQGDTIDRLGSAHKVLQDFTKRPRVVTCSQITPTLLRLYFKVVTEEGGKELISQLIPIIIERSGLLYGQSSYQNQVRDVLVEGLLESFRLHPSLLMDQYSEILEFLGNSRNADDKENFFMHLIWIVGEYLSLTYDSRCSAKQMARMYETLETLAYEIVGLCQLKENSSNHSPSFISVLMTTLAKIASRSQDLIPRAMLCLTKLGNTANKATVRATLQGHANELICLLKLPKCVMVVCSVAAMILTPPPDVHSGRWHKDNHSMSSLLRITNDMLQQSN